MFPILVLLALATLSAAPPVRLTPDAGAGALSTPAKDARSSASWLTVSPETGAYTYTANPTNTVRTATITANGQTYSFTQPSAAPLALASITNPRAMAFSTDGVLYIAEENHVLQLTPGADAPITLDFDTPTALALDASNNLYVATRTGIQKRTGETVLELPFISALAIDPDGNILFTETATNTLQKRTPNATITLLTGLNQPSALAVTSTGLIYIADTGNHRILQFNPATNTQTPLAETLSAPAGLTLAPNGDLYITDAATHTIYTLSPEGALAPLPNESNLNGPTALALDPSGKLLIADTNNRRIQTLSAPTQRNTGFFPPFLVSATPSNPAPSTQIFNFIARDLDGANTISRVYFLINSTPNITANSCHGFYDRALNAIYLYDDSLSNLNSLTNSQCTANSFSAVTGGNDLSLILTLTRKNAAPANLYLWITDTDNNGTGWISVASWRNVPSLVSATPSSTSATSQQFSIVARDSDGAADLNRIYFLVNPTPDVPQNTCHGFYDRALNAVYLYNDTLTSLASLTNSQCGVTAFTAAASGTDITLTLTINKTTTTNANVYLWIVDNESNGTGWFSIATWNAPAASRPPVFVSGIPVTVGSATTTQQFTITARDPDGFANINRIYFLLNPTPDIPQNSCHGLYDRTLNSVFLYDDTLTNVSSLTNSQCAVQGFSTAFGGTDFILNLTLNKKTTTPANFYVWITDNDSNGTGWVPAASWAGAVIPISIVSTAPTVAAAAQQQFTITSRSAAGFANLNRLYFLINNSTDIPQNTCHGYYDRARNEVYLYNDALTALLGPLTPGANAQIQNTQCAIDGATSTLVATAGTDLTLRLSITRKVPTTDQTLYLWQTDNQSNGTGWLAAASWPANASVNRPPVFLSSSPVTANGAFQTFQFTVRDPDGAGNINRVYFLINTSPNIAANTCHGLYDRTLNAFYLYDDPLTNLAGPLAPGSGSTLANSQCGVVGVVSSAFNANQTDLTLQIGFQRIGLFASSAQTVYLWTTDAANAGTGWVPAAIWNP